MKGHFLKDLFIPSKRNNYQAKILRPSFLSLLVFVFLLNQTLISFFALLRPGVLGYSSQITPEKIVELTNQERSKLGLNDLKINSVLSEAARQKAGDMFAFDYWAHQSPSGREPWSFLKEAGYDYRLAGENLARDFYDPSSVVFAWMKSPTHRENIVNPRYREIGVAVVEGTLGGIQTTLVVQFFGTPNTYMAENVPETKITPVTEELAVEGVAGVAEENSQALVSPLTLTRGISGFLFALITIALIIDGYLVARKKLYRSTGRTTAHAGFLLIMLLLVLFSGKPGLIN